MEKSPKPTSSEDKPEAAIPTLSQLISQKSPPTSKSTESSNTAPRDKDQTNKRTDTPPEKEKDGSASKSSGTSGKTK